MQRRKLEELNLLDDFLFNAVMTHPETGIQFTQKILQLIFDKEFTNLKVSVQKTYSGLNTDLRGARLDVCIEEDGSASIDGEEVPSVYDLEPDKNDKSEQVSALPKRTRFYHAIIDSRSLKSGEDFGKLKKVYVIFICDYDPFGYNRMLYTIKNRCVEEPEMPYEDGAETIVLYTKGKYGEISKKLKQFLKYMENTNSENVVNEDLEEIQKLVNIVKRDGEVSLRYMKSFEHDKIMYEEGRQAEMKNTEREKQRAETEKRKAEAEKQRAEAEKQRADELEAIVKKLQQQLKEQSK